MTFLPRKLLPPLLLGLGLLLIAGAVVMLLQEPAPPEVPSTIPARVNFPTPALTLTDLQGVSRSLSDYQGQVVLVNLWATWCPPCKAEMPAFQAFYEKHAGDGFTIIAINDGESRADVVRFVNEYGLTFPVWLDPTYIATEEAFQTRNLPTSYVIDRTGTIQMMWIGGISPEILAEYVTPLLMEQQ